MISTNRPLQQPTKPTHLVDVAALVVEEEHLLEVHPELGRQLPEVLLLLVRGLRV